MRIILTPSVQSDYRILTVVYVFKKYDIRTTGGAYNEGPENIFLQKWTGQKILDGSDLTSQTKTKKTKVDEPPIFLSRPYNKAYMRPSFYEKCRIS